jgi:hypothetical protein
MLISLGILTPTKIRVKSAKVGSPVRHSHHNFAGKPEKMTRLSVDEQDIRAVQRGDAPHEGIKVATRDFRLE